MCKKMFAMVVLCLTIIGLFAGCSKQPTKDYGVFLNVREGLDDLSDYRTVVIDAQFFTAEDVKAFKAKGHKVLTYLNVGSLENDRPYYKEYVDLALGEYEHWEEEVWIDVENEKWQKLILDDLVPSLIDKGVDGFFVDNCDVYYFYPTSGIFDGLTTIMRGLVKTDLDVIINSGDCFLDTYCEDIGNWNDVITGINQETIFSGIEWDDETFTTCNAEDHEFFSDYVERYGKMGADIYLLEYTTDKDLKDQIVSYCKEHGFKYYVTDSLLLDK